MDFKTDNLLNQANLDTHHSSLSSAEKTFADEARSSEVFSALKAKLLNIQEWNDHSMLSSYQLFDENGQTLKTEKLAVGQFLRISLKGTLKYDWIRILDIVEAADEFIITVKPASDPTAEKTDKSVISHFFTDESTNNFCLLKRANTVAFYVIGLDEKQNTSETKNALETIRNVAVNLGSYLGIQKGEWEKFCHDFLNDASNEGTKTNAL
ncbi:MAG: hypothetical protein ABJA66_03815 [Actinomycetota bacterium]